jgi:Uma2 family endonuclease
MEKYLNTAYSPDREYVDGEVVERHIGERPQSLLQGNILLYLRTKYPKLFVWTEHRLRTVPGRRSRAPDLCVTLEDPNIDVFEAPPLIRIEILSRRDEMSGLLEKLDEYIALAL